MRVMKGYYTKNQQGICQRILPTGKVCGEKFLSNGSGRYCLDCRVEVDIENQRKSEVKRRAKRQALRRIHEL